MDTVIKKVELSLPEMDMVLLKELAEKYGWSIGNKNSGIQKGLDDIKAGRTYRAKDMNDLKQHLLG